MTGPATLDGRLRVFALAATLLGLLLHAHHRWFLTDDAFISFRYARNLAHGDGLVFNPGGERVEGYTNFLWVAILAGLDRIGLAPETAAPWLGLMLTVVLWGLVAVYVLRLSPSPPAAPTWILCLPLVMLAATRSVAVWATSGLETRLFETLIVGGVLALFTALETPAGQPASATAASRWLGASGILFGLAALTRPDGILIAGAAFVAAAASLHGASGAARRLLRPVMLFTALAGGHLLFRWLYYGDLVPNTWHAKVGGRTWWSMGGAYLALFALEYAVIVWAPLLIAGARHLRQGGLAHRPAILAAVILPHALYITAIGGDHFEFRPFDLYFPFLFLLVHDGARALVSAGRPALAAAGALAVVATLLNPWPLPGHARLLAHTTGAFVGVRAEEHAAFLASIIPEGKALGRLVQAGILPANTHVAIDCVGAIPYYSGLRVFDRLGLTERQAARERRAPGVAGTGRLMAHDQRAAPETARARGVDLWAADFVHLLWDPADPRFGPLVAEAARQHASVWAAAAGDEGYLLATPLQGLASARQRFPRLEFRPVSESIASAPPESP